jgi:hypothetical protein
MTKHDFKISRRVPCYFGTHIQGSDMPQPQSGRAVANESKCLFIVELFVDAGELSVELNHRMMDFHRSRKIQIQH